MSRQRTVSLGKLVRGPGGRYLCRYCQVEVKPPRRTFCSDECVHEWSIRSNPGYAKLKVLARDKGICCLCGLDTEALVKRFRACQNVLLGRYGYFYMLRYLEGQALADRAEQLLQVPALAEEARTAIIEWTQLALQYPWAHRALMRRKNLWDMDHEKPVVEGGGQCGLDNLRTLCIECHLKETRELHKRLRKRK